AQQDIEKRALADTRVADDVDAQLRLGASRDLTQSIDEVGRDLRELARVRVQPRHEAAVAVRRASHVGHPKTSSMMLAIRAASRPPFGSSHVTMRVPFSAAPSSPGGTMRFRR